MVVSAKTKSLKIIGFSVVAIIIFNWLADFSFTRFDLTAEKRFTLSNPSKKLIQEIDSTMLFTIYLDGELPSHFKRLQKEFKELLDEFNAYNQNVDYEFVNLNEIENKEARTKAQFDIIRKGAEAYPLKTLEKGEEKRTVIFPTAIITYKGKQTSLSILKVQQGFPEELMINNSINTLEYRIATAIKEVTHNKQKIAFLEGHGELDDYQVADVTYSLSKSYDVRRGKIIPLYPEVLDTFKCIIIANPQTKFTEQEKFVIDRYIMKGGKIIWFVGGAVASMDSLRKSKNGVMLAYSNDLNLNDQLFKYGVRINNNLLQDEFCGRIPMVVGVYNNQPQFEQVPWSYFPLLMPISKHIIVKNLNPINTEFVSTIDTVKTQEIRKTILLASSEKSKIISLPTQVDVRESQVPVEQWKFDTPPQNVAVLLEGNFSSVFKNRAAPEGVKAVEVPDKSISNKMIIVSEGGLIKNQLDKKTGRIIPIRDDYFGNKDFLMNSVDYLIDDSGLINLRNKEVHLRLLNNDKIKNARFLWQFINVIFPIFLILLWGIINSIIRKRKYTNAN